MCMSVLENKQKQTCLPSFSQNVHCSYQSYTQQSGSTGKKVKVLRVAGAPCSCILTTTQGGAVSFQGDLFVFSYRTMFCTLFTGKYF